MRLAHIWRDGHSRPDPACKFFCRFGFPSPQLLGVLYTRDRRLSAPNGKGKNPKRQCFFAHKKEERPTAFSFLERGNRYGKKNIKHSRWFQATSPTDGLPYSWNSRSTREDRLLTHMDASASAPMYLCDTKTNFAGSFRPLICNCMIPSQLGFVCSNQKRKESKKAVLTDSPFCGPSGIPWGSPP